MIPTEITSKGNSVKVTENGELVVGSLEYSSPYYVRTLADATVYNIVPAAAENRFIITGILVATSKAIVGTATIDIYEAESGETATESRSILTIDMIKEDRLYLNLFNVATDGVRYINIAATDSEVDCTVFGYYVEV